VKRHYLACILLFAFAAEATPLPDTPVGHQLAGWLAVFSRGDQTALEQFINTRFSKALLDESSAADRASRVARTYVDARGFAIRTIERSSPEELTAAAQASLTGLWFRIHLKVESKPPYRITEYTADRMPPPAGVSRKLSQHDLIDEVDRFITTVSAADAFSGTVLIAKDGKPIYQRAVGWASKAYAYPNRMDTKFNLASIGKSFTAVAIAQLVEAGKLSYNDPVGKLLPEYPNKDVRETVTIHHLLSHTSGLGDIYSPQYTCVRATLREVRDYFPLFENEPHPLAFAPGTRWQYSNIGYILLGAIIEKVSGENFFRYVEKNVFRRAGMTGAGYYETDLDTPNVATGYTNFIELGPENYEFRLGPRHNMLMRMAARGNPQGGAIASAGDLLRFTNALFSHQLIRAASLEVMTSVKVQARHFEGEDTFWGYGFEIENTNGQRVIGHGGGDFGISCVYRVYPDSGNYTVIVLSNYERHIVVFKLHELILYGKS
jgi:CubicO group peptidase (beta-lactamase class C family)